MLSWPRIGARESKPFKRMAKADTILEKNARARQTLETAMAGTK
jgi:hypothetical protein